jgi:hypothetical protein
VDTLDLARSLGVAMGSRIQGIPIGYTTNEDAAEQLRAAGATVTRCGSPRRQVGWEIVIRPLDTETEV